MSHICLNFGPGYILRQKFCPERGLWQFQKIPQFCWDLLLAFSKISEKFVRIVTRPQLPLPGVLERLGIFQHGGHCFIFTFL